MESFHLSPKLGDQVALAIALGQRLENHRGLHASDQTSEQTDT